MLNRPNIITIFFMAGLFFFHLIDSLLKICFQLRVIEISLQDSFVRRNVTGTSITDHTLHKCGRTRTDACHKQKQQPYDCCHTKVNLSMFLKKVGNFSPDFFYIINRSYGCCSSCLFCSLCFCIFPLNSLLLDQFLKIVTTLFLIFIRCR